MGKITLGVKVLSRNRALQSTYIKLGIRMDAPGGRTQKRKSR